ncbi:von Willebrand factor A domain-containing protein 7 [Labeo rohita]|uniref:von Willebrand factor A domain-containing protein 7 n=1 Tax=Labeo rohita TaxID=84645 RepID=A0ABQ8MVM3_LABRO|nr:von Willebrand factor A domain-containing protein 7 [Labeo rohita]
MRSAFLLLALLTGAQTFHILEKPNSKNHQDITAFAILRATVKVCEKVEGFTKPEPLNTQTLAKACKKDAFKSNFEAGIEMITHYNTQTDVTDIASAKHHFNSEKFLDGKALIIKGIEDIAADVKKEDFENARKTLGSILHTLQDFYSHSNWIELGNTEPCTALINLEESIPNPAGKCSHGGTLDFTTGFGRGWDGINKDAIDSSHGLDHHKAADVAIAASVQLLEKIWNNDDPSFFRLIGLHKDKPKGTWKTFFSFSSSKSRVSDANGKR